MFIFTMASLVIQWRFVHRIEKQMKSFMKGFNEIVPQRCIQMFDPKEFEVRIISYTVQFNKYKIRLNKFRLQCSYYSVVSVM